MFYVYILKCTDGSLYTGSAKDLEKRLAKHMIGAGSKYVRSRLPFILVYSESFEDWSLTLKRETEIKRLNKKQKLELVATSSV